MMPCLSRVSRGHGRTSRCIFLAIQLLKPLRLLVNLSLLPSALFFLLPFQHLSSQPFFLFCPALSLPLFFECLPAQSGRFRFEFPLGSGVCWRYPRIVEGRS